VTFMIPAEQEIITSPMVVLIGPTAIGKTSLSLTLARHFDVEIVSVDSMQVYRYMNIGTAKPSQQERAQVVHHLIDIADPDEQYDAARFVRDALSAIRTITAAGRIPLLTGGTGLYLKALTQGLFVPGNTGNQHEVRRELLERMRLEGRDRLFAELRDIDPATAARIHPNDTQRLLRALEIYLLSGIPWSEHLQRQPGHTPRFNRILQFGLTCERSELYQRIEQRTGQMMEQGLIGEVENLREMGYDPSLQSMQSIGYRHANKYIDGLWDWAETLRLLIRDTKRYAKRQMTWFSKIPEIHWVDRRDIGRVLQRTEEWLSGSECPNEPAE